MCCILRLERSLERARRLVNVVRIKFNLAGRIRPLLQWFSMCTPQSTSRLTNSKFDPYDSTGCGQTPINHPSHGGALFGVKPDEDTVDCQLQGNSTLRTQARFERQLLRSIEACLAGIFSVKSTQCNVKSIVMKRTTTITKSMMIYFAESFRSLLELAKAIFQTGTTRP